MALPQRKLARDYEKERAQLKSLLEKQEQDFDRVKQERDSLLTELNHLKSLWFVKLYLKYFKKG